ncbi:hypothetical protein MPSI1_002889 [Malassezia psittaci]|uniref:DUF202 domain-containing protein n=1 Tax=Malassezia psittaci TaxID=1821823 RepID=A0AAF0F7R2_9BASI|nr:hypothetical protein MPSI1_002889 [Malassezia psittaci]
MSQSQEQQPLLHGQSSREYGTTTNEIPVPKPRPVKSPVKVEAKVWFANEPEPVPPPFEPGPVQLEQKRMFRIVRSFGIIYALISVMTLLWGLYNYQRRVTLIKSRWAGSFDDLIGPPVVCAATFVAILANFIVAMKQHY